MTALDLATAKELSGQTGLDARTCTKHARAAGLHEYPGRKFERQPALDAIAKLHDPHLTLGHRMVGRGGVMLPGAAELSANRARSEAARAEKLERDNRIKNGDLLPRAAVEAASKDIIARARTHFMGMGPRVSARLASMDDERRIIEFLDAECRITLRELAALNDVHAELLA